MVVVEPGVRLKRDDLRPGGHDALDSGGDGLFCSGERTDGVHTEVIFCVARAGTVDERCTPGNGGTQRGAVKDVKCLFTVRWKNGQLG